MMEVYSITLVNSETKATHQQRVRAQSLERAKDYIRWQIAMTLGYSWMMSRTLVLSAEVMKA